MTKFRWRVLGSPRRRESASKENYYDEEIQCTYRGSWSYRLGNRLCSGRESRMRFLSGCSIKRQCETDGFRSRFGLDVGGLAVWGRGSFDRRTLARQGLV